VADYVQYYGRKRRLEVLLYQVEYGKPQAGGNAKGKPCAGALYGVPQQKAQAITVA
jgi:hypothetical protein